MKEQEFDLVRDCPYFETQESGFTGMGEDTSDTVRTGSEQEISNWLLNN
jgi:hypothetical protein